ncbi:hypothetical protein AGABI1DRAFT_132106 [Agaricus bisporus var. burnettii JB137-S8]|uniref:Uncharacterized protein n=1 Tax=Agaricus bisporus var. burnettii (strain JB137-S8 / ATCC MYA-4627 / FGSC 10392) TaxID=597362 RepID=K5WYB8_AGABU|nr:uncharacterized protein AGABI1DRAFT_132106 [Agaricus bisporus var. burnettii JB137-S8]EKM75567.1 hypothetical protein AGABI1DRAFT_132106 [Agaricus bisporus var. burnettii JB137-S8]
MPPQKVLDLSSDKPFGILRTPVPNLFGHNTSIGRDDVISIRTAFSAVEMRLSGLVDSSHISDSKRFVREHRKLLSSWTRRVPPEILILIFLHCLDPVRLSPPWYLSHICRYWRELALHTPQLWTRIPLPTLLNRSRVAEALVAFMPEYIGRSKDQAITFRWEGNWDPRMLDEDDEFEDPLCGHADAILDLLIQHAERWGSVSIVSGRWTQKLAQQLAQLYYRLTRLYHLGLDIEGFQVTSTEVFRATPRLKDIDLYTTVDQGTLQSFPNFIQWDELQRLKFELPTSAPLSFLSLCNKLVVLDIEFFGWEAPTSGPDKIILPNLRHLRFNSSLDSSVEHFEFFISPVLEDFRTCRIPEAEPLNIFVRFLQRNAKTLKYLTFGSSQHIPPSNALRSSLTLLPFPKLVHLEYLQLYYPYFDTVPSFISTISQETNFSRLHTLHLLLNNDYHLDYSRSKVLSNDLNALVRWAETPDSGSCLRHVEIISGQGSDVLDLFYLLEGWYIEDQDHEIIRFVKEELCELKLRRIYSFPFVNTDSIIVDVFNESQTQGVSDCLDTMELEIVNDVKLLYRTQVHFILHALGKMSPDQFTPESDQISERALALIKKWRYLFEDDIPRRRWMHKGLEKIVYIPIDDEFYRPNVEYWMYGLKPYFGNGCTEDVFF